MIVSHNFKFIFVHVSKTGGSSIQEQFRKVNNWQVDVAGKSREQAQRLLDDHYKYAFNHYSFAQIKYLWGALTYAEYFKWAVIRNPFDRVISAYYFHKYKSEVENDAASQEVLGNTTSLEEFICNKQEHLGTKQVDMLSIDGIIDCTVYRFEDGLDNAVRRASTHINNVFPNFPIMEKLTARELTQHRTDRRHYREVITPECRAIIEGKYKEDFETFGYMW